ncbi:MAG: hypothetical protein COU69_03725 [Candidatus Pacebacteria bacterium CG10_big_fil_rev_8_21_14_0_10_56_10]|nr:MAG: hypothetical protein COU69_03725 [Candidatus Pacebacteria bacterium CG10_big_fil_rev_8_21_14_0_10_56_10]
MSQAGEAVTEQLVRPTGLVDPPVELRRTRGQIEDLAIEILERKRRGQRTLVTTLTKKMAEALTEYLNQPTKVRRLIERFHAQQRAVRDDDSLIDPDQPINCHHQLPVDQLQPGKIEPQYYTSAQQRPPLPAQPRPPLPKVAYLHSDVTTLERSDILDDLRSGKYDVLVGINLLREGLDLPEVTLVAVLDADKEGFLRSKTSLIQTMGRAARHADGRAILYAQDLTKSMLGAIAETQRRRQVQLEYNQRHRITPASIAKPIRQRMIEKRPDDQQRLSSGKRGLAGRGRSATKLQLTKHSSVVLDDIEPDSLTPQARKTLAAQLRRRMNRAARDLDYELAAAIRDTVQQLTTPV